VTTTPVPTPVDFDLDEAVRLIDRTGGVASGSLGRVLGKLPDATGPTSYVVSFVAEKVSILAVLSREIVPAHRLRAPLAAESALVRSGGT
jgi:hypothetical protein